MSTEPTPAPPAVDPAEPEDSFAARLAAPFRVTYGGIRHFAESERADAELWRDHWAKQDKPLAVEMARRRMLICGAVRDLAALLADDKALREQVNAALVERRRLARVADVPPTSATDGEPEVDAE